MLLVDDDQSEMLEGKEDGTTGTEDDVVGIGGELFLPDFHTLGIGIFGVIYAYTTAKDSLQTLGHLYRKGYLRQKEQHLPTLVYCLLDKMDIHLGLPARRDAMQKDDILGHELHQDLIVCILLDDTQGINPLGMWLSAVVQSSYFLLVSLEYASVAQSFKNPAGSDALYTSPMDDI